MPVTFQKTHHFTASLVVAFFLGVMGGFLFQRAQSLSGPTAGPNDQGVGNPSSAKGSLATTLGSPTDSAAATSLFGRLANLESQLAAIPGGGGGTTFPLSRTTAASYKGYLGGWSGADARCQAEYGSGWNVCRTSQDVLAQSHSNQDDAYGRALTGCPSTDGIAWCNETTENSSIYAISGKFVTSFGSCPGLYKMLCCAYSTPPANSGEKCSADVLASFGDSVRTRYDSTGPVLEALLYISSTVKRVPINLADGTGDSTTAPSVNFVFQPWPGIWKGNEILAFSHSGPDLMISRYDTAGSYLGGDSKKVAQGSIDDGDPNTVEDENVDTIKKVVEGSNGYAAALYTLSNTQCTVTYLTCPAETPCNGFPDGTVFQTCPESTSHYPNYKTAVVNASANFVNADIEKQVLVAYKGGFILHDSFSSSRCYANENCDLELYTYTNGGVLTKWTDIPAISAIRAQVAKFSYVIGSKNSAKVYLLGETPTKVWQIDMTTMAPTEIPSASLQALIQKVRDDWTNKNATGSTGDPSLSARGGQMFTLDAGDTKHVVTYYEPQTASVGTVKNFILNSTGLITEGPSQTTEFRWSAAQDLTTDKQWWLVYDVPDGSVRTRRIDLSGF